MRAALVDSGSSKIENERSLLDVIRGVLVSLSNRGDGYFHPVSTLAIRAGLARRNLDVAPSDHLSTLYTIGDVQRLAHGYWMPVPPTAVEAGEIAIIVSGLPTTTLQRHLGYELFGDGYSRLIAHSAAHSLFKRPFLEWARTPASTPVWTKTLIHSATFTRSFVNDDFEHFTHWSNNIRWVQGNQRTTIPDGIVLTRTKSTVGMDYLLCRIVDGFPISIHELVGGWPIASRIAWGLRYLHHNLGRFQIRAVDPSHMQLTLSRFIPPEEAVVLKAIGVLTSYPSNGRMSATFHSELTTCVQSMLNALGLEQDV